eukprot:TRINITY_DN6505_c0_g1_i1.p1 TRINITY_DN6505_c0_g1~~TRINITY_DN6505_c0_g1_i1.p1  ORF type:complete len:187 (+),score=4.56 TRINITY_DN6505_c0_g1_i1:221-781(+)
MEDHEMDRFATCEMLCMHCLTPQLASQKCGACEVLLGSYYCSICKFWSNGAKPTYHCEKCGICRVGKGLGIDFFHCDNCRACISLPNRSHKCIEGLLEGRCPICWEPMSHSTSLIDILPRCGHAIHKDCLQAYTRSGNSTCPTCFVEIHPSMSEIRRNENRMALTQTQALIAIVILVVLLQYLLTL